MNLSATAANIEEILSKEILENEEMIGYLKQGDLLKFEMGVKAKCDSLFNGIVGRVLPMVARSIAPSLRESGKESGFSKIVQRSLSIELHTGHRVTVPGLYAKEVSKEGLGHRHLLVRHWSISANSSPLRVSQVCMSAALCPSYDIGNEMIKAFGSNQSTTRTRNIVQAMSMWCSPNEVSLSLGKGETLKGKRVVLSVDGGRTRTKSLKAGGTAEGLMDCRKSGYDTPWCEPKLFVIQILNDKGEIERKSLPIYGVRFGESEVLSLLSEYLKALNIDQAQAVQIIADGAPWIWNNLKRMLLDAGVCEDCIVETLDYAHASGYVSKIVEALPARITESKRKSLLCQFKTLLWEGKTLEIVSLCKAIFKRPSQEITRWMNYLEKHCLKTQYADFKLNMWLCGSGIVESGIRRIINLRFKNPSTFWYKENVEKLFLFRAVCLAKRWNVFMQNFVQLEHN